MLDSTDAIVEYIYVKADAVAQYKGDYDNQKLIDLGYIRGLIAALFINQQITKKRYDELNDEIVCTKITGSKYFTR